MSITLLDIYAIAGFLPNGVPVKDIGPLESPKPANVPDNVLAYVRFFFFYRFYRTSSPIAADEHVGFLLFWLSKYILFYSLLKISKDFLTIASRLAPGTPIALGLLILAILYRGFMHASLAMRSKEDGSLFPFFSLDLEDSTLVKRRETQLWLVPLRYFGRPFA